MERIRITELRSRVSWGSIIAGVVTVLAISVLLSILGSSIGLYMFDPTSDKPVDGIGTTVGIWSVVSVLISLALGGFVAGKLAGRDGLIHGFMVWATTMIFTVILGVFLAISAVKFTTNVLGSIASLTGDVVSGVGSAVGGGVSVLSDKAQDIFGDIDITSDEDKKDVEKNVRDALRKSGVKELQPEYLQKEMKGVKSDLKKSMKKLVANPKQADKIIDTFLDRLKERGDKFSENIDRDDVARAIANNSDMSKAEADRAVDQYVEMIDEGREEAREQIQNLQQSVEHAKRDWVEMKAEALEEVDKASNAAATSALVSFFALLIGAVVCTFGGQFGTRKTQEGYEA